jgi:hypothetical protein
MRSLVRYQAGSFNSICAIPAATLMPVMPSTLSG